MLRIVTLLALLMASHVYANDCPGNMKPIPNASADALLLERCEPQPIWPASKTHPCGPGDFFSTDCMKSVVPDDGVNGYLQPKNKWEEITREIQHWDWPLILKTMVVLLGLGMLIYTWPRYRRTLTALKIKFHLFWQWLHKEVNQNKSQGEK